MQSADKELHSVHESQQSNSASEEIMLLPNTPQHCPTRKFKKGEEQEQKKSITPLSPPYISKEDESGNSPTHNKRKYQNLATTTPAAEPVSNNRHTM